MTINDAGPLYLVGAGKMGQALLAGWLAGGLTGDEVNLIDPFAGDAVKAMAQTHGIGLFDQAPTGKARVLVLAVKPQIMMDVLPQVAGLVDEETIILSIAAGITMGQISAGLGLGDRALKIVRTIPNTPAQVGKGITGAVAMAGVSADDRAVVGALMAAAGELVWVDRESDIDAVTAVSGSGPAYVFYLVEALAAAGQAQGLSAEVAMKLARATIIGGGALLDADPLPAGTLRENVTSPNGTTAAALAVLMGADGLGPLMAKAVDAARVRSEELSRG